MTSLDERDASLPGTGLGRRQRGLLFLGHLRRRLVEDDCLTAAGPLSYTALVALVPLAAVTLAVLSGFPVFDQLVDELRGFAFRNFVPAAGETVERYVGEFVEQASRLSLVGLVFLVVTALLLIAQIEQALNRIWRVETPRTLATRLLVYWAALTAGPLLIGTSLALSSYLVSLPLIEGAAASLGAGWLLLAVVPFAVEAIAFILAYLVLPNRPVSWRPVVAGGLLAAALFEIAKHGFAFYVTRFPTYELIYGALAAIPIFLAWIYLSWVVFLLGASFAAALESFRPQEILGGWDERLELVQVYRLVGHLWTAQRKGEALTVSDLRDRESAVSEARLDARLRTLEGLRLLSCENGRWRLARDLAEVSLLDLYRSGVFALPLPDELPVSDDAWNAALRRQLAPLAGPLAEQLGRPLKELYLQAEEPPAAELSDTALGTEEP